MYPDPDPFPRVSRRRHIVETIEDRNTQLGSHSSEIVRIPFPQNPKNEQGLLGHVPQISLILIL